MAKLDKQQTSIVKTLLMLVLIVFLVSFALGFMGIAHADSVGHHKHRHHHVTQVHQPVKPNTDSNGFTPAQQFGIGGVIIAAGAFFVYRVYRKTYRHHMRHRKLNNKNSAVKAHKKAHDDREAKKAANKKIRDGK